MITETHTKTQTEVSKDGTFLVSCFFDVNTDGTTNPEIYKSEVLQESKEINLVKGKEGELILSHSGSKAGYLDKDGNLVIETTSDDANKYYKDNSEDLIYEND